MAKKRLFELTPHLTNTIAAYIRAGGYPHVAAEAAGIPKDVFDEWLRLGCPLGRKKGWRPHKKFTPFWLVVMEARAQARLKAEMEAMKKDPIAWLKSGPGKDAINNPGWSSVTKPIVNETNNTVNVLLTPEMQGVFASLLQVLSPYPAARAAVAQALAGKDPIVLPHKAPQPGRPDTA